MTGKTISTTITHTVTLGSGSYVSPLTIATAGTIDTSAPGATGLYLPAAAAFATIVNHGLIEAGYTNSAADSGISGGSGIVLGSAATLNNSGRVLGGIGLGGTYAGNGGIGIYVLAAATIVSSGTIYGGDGGSGIYRPGAGGVAVDLASNSKLTNSGIITGGSGGTSSTAAGTHIATAGGGAGVFAAQEDVVSNSGTIAGGYGGANATIGLDGGVGVALYKNGTLTNGGRISGEDGGGVNGYQAGAGGDGVVLNASTGTNTGRIFGGYGGESYGPAAAGGSEGGAGGIGAVVVNYSDLTNSGVIQGEDGGFSLYGVGGAAGAGVSVASYGNLVNTGQIGGGDGATTAYKGLAGNAGGAGVAISGGNIVNHGSISGGEGGQSLAGVYQHSGDGGAGIASYRVSYPPSEAGISINNYGLIRAGAAGYAYDATAISQGVGGIGLDLFAGAATNHGTIIGGAGGTVSTDSSGGGAGGLGVYLGIGTSLGNSGTIIGGTGGFNTDTGTTGGIGVLIAGATFTDSGAVKGGAGGDGGPQGAAVAFSGNTAGTLVLNPGASFSGIVEGYGANNVLALAGTSTTTLSGIGSEFAGFGNLSFATGAQRIVEGSITAFANIIGFATHDIIVLDGFTADLADTTISGPDIDLSNGTSDNVLYIPHALAKDLILTDGGGKTTLTAATGTLSHTLTSTMEQFVLAGGLATSTTIDTGSHAEIYNGGTAASFKLAGGTLELQVGAKFSGGAGFTTIKGGDLILDSATMPAATISGFIAGDSIKLAGIAYNSHDTVTVKTAGIVSIITPGTTYNLNIAGATVGEAGFKFSTGSVLTTAATTNASMAFLTPGAAVFAAGHGPAATPPETRPGHTAIAGILGARPYDTARPHPPAAMPPPEPAAAHPALLPTHAGVALIGLPHHWAALTG